MKPLHDYSPARSCAVCCDLAADAVVRAGLELLPELRRHPGSVCGEPLPVSFLKHADEQTVAGLAAVFKAIHSAGMQDTNFHDWGVVAAPRFLGRSAMAAALQRFQAEGAWGVSPHLIPHRSLHSISGTVSQALKIHGPNFGTGGGPGGAAEALLAATAMLEGQQLPGVWVVMTCLDPEQPLEQSGKSEEGTQCVGLALALTPIPPTGGTLSLPDRVRLRLVCGTSLQEQSADDSEVRKSPGSGFDLPRLEALLGLLRGEAGGATKVVQLLDCGSRIELSRSAIRSPQSAVSNQLSVCGLLTADC